MNRQPGICLGLLLLATPAIGDPHGLDRPTKQWRQGPVRYLLTRPEAQAFKRLPDDASRGDFVAAFWRRRDPTPETARNEFREEFWDRVDRTESLRLFLESTKPMWLTDLGKWFILFGPPHESEKDLVAGSTRDTVVWTYHGVPGVREPHFSLVFVADDTGELRLSDSPSLDQSTVRGLAAHSPTHIQGLGGSRAPGTRVGSTLLEQDDPLLASWGSAVSGTDDGRSLRTGELGAQAAAPGDAQADPAIGVTASFDALPVQVHTDYYRADDDSTYTAFTFAVPGSVSAELVPFGGIVSLDDEAVTFSLDREDQFASAGEDSPATFQTGLGLDPGRYRALFGFRERSTGRIGTWKADLTVPELQGVRLTLSSLTLARTLQPLEQSPDTSFKVPFVYGRLRVVPRAAPTLHNGDEFHLYYEVYGARPSPDEEPLLDVTYRFEGKSDDGWIALGQPIEQAGRSGGVQAWSFPLQGWPPGEFRLSVTVTDRNSGYSASRTLEFSVTDTDS